MANCVHRMPPLATKVNRSKKAKNQTWPSFYGPKPKIKHGLPFMVQSQKSNMAFFLWSLIMCINFK